MNKNIPTLHVVFFHEIKIFHLFVWGPNILEGEYENHLEKKNIINN